MDFEKLRDELGSRYFKISEYFNTSFNIFKHMLKTSWGKKVLFLLTITMLPALHPTILFATGLANFILSIILIFSVKNTIELIEEKKSISHFKFIFRLLNLSVLYLIFIFTSLVMFLGMDKIKYIFVNGVSDREWFSFLLSMLPYIVIYIILGIFMYVYLIYFQIIYFTRNITLIESLKYNSYIAKGNRIRIIVPHLMVMFVTTVFSLIMSTVSAILVVVSPYFVILTNVINALTILITLYGVVLEVLIYLNVEYMDLNKENN